MYHKITLDNGIRLITAPMPHTRSVSVGFYIGTGSRYETERQSGISHFIEHLCFKGTRKRPTPIDICTVVEGVGGILNAGTDKEMTIYWCKVAQPHFPAALDMLVDILTESRFDPEDIEKERQVIIEEIKMTLDAPSQRASMLIDEALWPDHPLGWDVAGSRESMAGITRQMMLDYLAGQYRPENIVLSIAGDINEDEVREMVNKTTAVWKNGGTVSGYLPYRKSPGRRVIIERRDTEQTQLCLALPGLSITHPQRFKLDLLNIVLGEGMSSRLFTEIRDKLGLAYSIQSYTEHFLDTGAIVVVAGVDTASLKVAVKAILSELARIKELVPEEELSRAKELFKGRILLRMEDSRSVSGWLGGQEVLTGNILSVDQVIDTVNAVTADDVRDVAEELLVGEQLRLAAVGPVSPDEPLEDLLEL